MLIFFIIFLLLRGKLIVNNMSSAHGRVFSKSCSIRIAFQKSKFTCRILQSTTRPQVQAWNHIFHLHLSFFLRQRRKHCVVTQLFESKQLTKCKKKQDAVCTFPPHSFRCAVKELLGKKWKNSGKTLSERNHCDWDGNWLRLNCCGCHNTAYFVLIFSSVFSKIFSFV